jgi:hypothetical protein
MIAPDAGVIDPTSKPNNTTRTTVARLTVDPRGMHDNANERPQVTKWRIEFHPPRSLNL